MNHNKKGIKTLREVITIRITMTANLLTTNFKQLDQDRGCSQQRIFST